VARRASHKMKAVRQLRRAAFIRIYKPETDGIPIYQTRAEYRKYDQGQVGKRVKDLEIGWNIPATRSARSMKFDVTMTFVGVTTLYKDIARFQWEPIASDNTVPVGDWIRRRNSYGLAHSNMASRCWDSAGIWRISATSPIVDPWIWRCGTSTWSMPRRWACPNGR